MTNDVDQPRGSLLSGWKGRILVAALLVLALAAVLVIALQGRLSPPTTNAPAETTAAVVKPPPVVSIPDRDGDRLSDDEETSLGTSPDNADTDNDRLFDYEEVKVWQTNPVSPDTDTDGVLDGDEVRQGRNPGGAGRFLDINAALTNQAKP